MTLGLDPKLVNAAGHLNEHAAPDKLASALSVQEAWATFTAAVSKLAPEQQQEIANKIVWAVVSAAGGIVEEER
ncbi:hypothetical protein [Streptomyces sp. NPDC101150]|uniref:hypothetical protein n=1 Tax=Streptomyces sp. NPDC101150 TaxID=3366114 RepID=UPI003819B800